MGMKEGPSPVTDSTQYRRLPSLKGRKQILTSSLTIKATSVRLGRAVIPLSWMRSVAIFQSLRFIWQTLSSSICLQFINLRETVDIESPLSRLDEDTKLTMATVESLPTRFPQRPNLPEMHDPS